MYQQRQQRHWYSHKKLWSICVFSPIGHWQQKWLVMFQCKIFICQIKKTHEWVKKVRKKTSHSQYWTYHRMCRHKWTHRQCHCRLKNHPIVSWNPSQHDGISRLCNANVCRWLYPDVANRQRIMHENSPPFLVPHPWTIRTQYDRLASRPMWYRKMCVGERPRHHRHHLHYLSPRSSFSSLSLFSITLQLHSIRCFFLFIALSAL